jgi:DNA-binding transcriptional LysR family regulator
MVGDVDALVIFATVVERGGFGAASLALGIPKTTVSRKVALLEKRLGMRLLHRTTRRVTLTDFGLAYLEHGRRIVDELRAADATLASSRAEPGGLVRATASVLLAQAFLGPILAEFAQRYPAVRLELEVTDRVADLVENRFDVAFRTGRLPDSGLVARKLGVGYSGLYAAPTYLAGAGHPKEPEDLDSHALVANGAIRTSSAGLSWTLRRGHEERTLVVAPRLAVSDALVALAFALHGRGIARLPTFVAAPSVLEHRLVPVLPDWIANEVEINALFPSHRGLPLTVRTLLDFTADRLATSLARRA